MLNIPITLDFKLASEMPMPERNLLLRVRYNLSKKTKIKDYIYAFTVAHYSEKYGMIIRDPIYANGKWDMTHWAYIDPNDFEFED